MSAGFTALIGHINKPTNEPQWLRFGLPLNKNLCADTSSVQLVSEFGQPIEAHICPVTRWNDGSVQWVLVDVIAEASGAVFLTAAPDQNAPAAQAQKPLPGCPAVSVGNGKIRLGDGISAELSILIDGSSRALTLIEEQGQSQNQERGRAKADQHSNSICQEHNWSFTVEGISSLELTLQAIEVFATGQLVLKAKIHNLAASLHPNGCWDLGDPNSVNIQRLSLEVSDEKTQKTSLILSGPAATGGPERVFPGGMLTQYGSGGKNWNSPVHVDKTGQPTVNEQGYKLRASDGTLLEQGLRASPIVRFEKDSIDRLIIPRQFWENCPSALELQRDNAVWHLFPKETELQPGESKTWTCDVGVSEPCAEFQYQPAYIDATEAMLGSKLSINNPLSQLLDANLTGPESFFNKRETCDEYGWRHFGELYADHEALNAKGSELFVSHYNNQYDPIWGFSLRYLATGNQRWQHLASDLAQHVVDIDIYKTDRDKAEYNNGLFWHTDHYLPALTATHRTYSQAHEYAYEGHQGGGGPGGQHCYTSGLAIRYLLSGDPAFRQSVIGLSQWIKCFYNGAPGVIARLHRFLTVDLKPGKMTNVGYIENGYKYPLDRGTGHYLNALIDAYLVTQDATLLSEMYGVISETVSPQDDLAARDLGNVEERWFYIVFLQSLARYLLFKEQLEQADQHYAYARHTLIYYADWVLKNEKPYLTNPESLEFPTDTWAAQDLRKANVLYYAAYFNPSNRELLSGKADEFWNYCVATLKQSPERNTTRIQAIIAQNLGVREWVLERASSVYPLTAADRLNMNSARRGTAARFLKEILSALRSLSINNEIQWLKSRLGKR
jgi:hypothetical protein